ncbi:harmonin isoform X2 [Anthonomus grandis grandis]|uniref:harmonin isoform X2 n=1 Tax=Anthonomus grandis grandis TaxID=2921223 RepID=UPI0021658806|nr:harmonin isoform X2 [Anthonomus grandis grandis]
MLASEYGTVGFQQHKYACSTMSAETISESCGSRNNRIRTIRLVRPSHGPLPPPGVNYRHGPSLGFSIRGGREHGTGIFVSYVEVGSEASLQGLRVGDQIIRVNGFAVDDAVHKEVLQLISNHTHLTLKVRGVGMIPVKEKKTDALSWQIITDCGSSPTRGSPQLGEKLNDVRITIVVAPKSKLGCGISKGPDWKPGIFVQFSKEGGIARDAGLRPGDQILYCNNVDFSDINFNEAVSLMKSSRQLNLLVRKGAGLDLFPGESSGYNSSASSVTEDQSPPWSDSKRLSIVKEENLDLGERLNHLDKFKNLLNTSNKWDTWDEDPEEKPLFKPTIINLTENGTTIHNNGSIEPIIEEYSSTSNYNPYRKSCTIQDQETLEDIYAVAQKQRETKTVVVDVHRSDVDASRHDNGHLALMKSPSSSSFCSIASKSSCTSSITSSMTTSSLSSAITMELQRRQKKALSEKPSIEEQLQIKKILKNVDDDKQHQHSKLMDEFKKAHQRMFKNNEPTDEDPSKTSSMENDERLKNNKNNELSRKLAERLSDLHLQNGASDNDTKGMTLNAKKNPEGSMPPPPPPPPQFNGTTTTAESSASSSTPSSPTSSTRSNTLKKPKAPPVPVKYSILSYKTANNSPNPPPSVKNQSFNQPPPCPTPDYDTLSLASSYGSGLTSKSPLNRTKNDDSAEMQSIDSFKINNSTSEVQPKPPSTYFQKRTLATSLSNQSSKTSTIRKSRPISVTIGEYPSMRRQPGRLDFLQNGTEVINGQSIGNRLTSELTQTLNRSNLKKKTESMENLLNDYGDDSSTIKTQKNGSVQISVSKLSRALAKSTSDLTEDAALPTRRNRVTINVNLTKPDSILKNSDGRP